MFKLQTKGCSLSFYVWFSLAAKVRLRGMLSGSRSWRSTLINSFSESLKGNPKWFSDQASFPPANICYKLFLLWFQFVSDDDLHHHHHPWSPCLLVRFSAPNSSFSWINTTKGRLFYSCFTRSEFSITLMITGL